MGDSAFAHSKFWCYKGEFYSMGLWVIIICQWRLIICNKCTAQVGDVNYGESYARVGQGIYGKSRYLTLNFYVNLKLL